MGSVVRSTLLSAFAIAAIPVTFVAAQAPTIDAPLATTAPSTTPTCAVTGPRLDDPRAALRTGLPAKQTIIALDREQRKALPDAPLPGTVRARLKEVGAFFGPIDDDGTISVKSLWRKDLRRAKGRLRVTGTRLDAPGGRFSVDLNRDYSERRTANFVPGSLIFSTTGCWQINGRAGKARVTYVALVRRPEPEEFAPYLP